MPGVGFLIIRSAFALAEQIAPSLTGRAAFALFRRTLFPPALNDEIIAYQAARQP